MSMDLQSVWKQLAKDKRKLGLMMALLCFAMLLWGRLLLKDVPRTANAEPAAVVKAPATEDKEDDVADNTAVDRPVVLVQLMDRVQRDPFNFNRSYYPIPKGDVPGDDGPTKLTVNSSDDSNDRREAESSVRAAAQHLTLQSTLLGNQPRAVINGVLMAPGELIQGFELKSVRSRAVTVVRNGFVIELEM